MSEERTYLELSEESGSHKFYEVVVRGCELSIRYGRIGDQGQLKVTTFPTEDKARAEAQKKIGEKLRKGYERAVMGVRKKRAVVRRSTLLGDTAPPMSSGVVSRPSDRMAPVVWKFNTGKSAFGIFVDADLCWVGNEAGDIYALDHTGQVLRSFKLPDGVKCIVADDVWLYAGCDDGKVYDLNGKLPHVAYEIDENIDILWLDIFDGVLGVSDAQGSLTTINHEDESQWFRKGKGSSGWMVRCDEIGVYHGTSTGVVMYDWVDGRLIWERPTQGAVLFGWQEESLIYACTSLRKVYSYAKNGDLLRVYDCDNPVLSCAAAEGGKYVFAADNFGFIYCFRESGERLWKLSTGVGSAFSMQYFRSKLYVVSSWGWLACVDASETAIAEANEGRLPQTISLQAPVGQQVTVASDVETTTDATGGVVLECYREGSKLRVRVITPGYRRDWHCQFPKEIRQEGMRYVVDGVREAQNGNFYRILGNIRKLKG